MMGGMRVTVSHGEAQHELEPGDVLLFGRGESVDLHLDDDTSLSRLTGYIEVGETDWSIANRATFTHLTVRDTGSAGLVQLAPGLGPLVVPFAAAVVEVPLKEGRTIAFTVAADGIAPGAIDAGAALAGEATEPAWVPNRTAKYFRCLVALCAPRLRDPHSTDLPTDQQIASLINRLGVGGARLNDHRVANFLAYVRGKLGLSAQPDNPGETATGLQVKDARRVLVDRAIALSIVTAADLHVLEPAAED